MTEIERKALELVNEVCRERYKPLLADADFKRYRVASYEALCRAIEQHEAFRQEVSDVIEQLIKHREAEWLAARLNRFIITKPDPLVEVMNEMGFGWAKTASDELRAALAKRGGRIVFDD